MINHKTAFSEYIHKTNISGSKKADSYIRAIDLLGEMLLVEPFSFGDCKNLWAINSVERLHELYLFVLQEARKKNASKWAINGIPKSYLQKGYCSAALKSYQEFLVEYNYETSILDIFEQYEGDEAEIAEKLNVRLKIPEFIIEDLSKLQGEDAVQAVRVRTNQNIFRKMIMKLYNHTCCITGLNIPEINRASHIIPWAKDETKRLDPKNGLYLSATYDAAFDKGLISLDDDYRVIVSKNITDHYINESVQDYFLNIQGKEISLPSVYKPEKTYLAKHREKGDF